MYLGLPATAAVADMPVGAPPPFASTLEPGSRWHADKRGTARLSRDDHRRRATRIHGHDHRKMAYEETPSAQRKLSCAKQELEEVPNDNCRWL